MLAHLKVIPFTIEQIYYYVWNYTQQEINQNGEGGEWTYEQFSKVIDLLLQQPPSMKDEQSNPSMKDELSNPFVLSIAVQMLPSVMNKLKKEYCRKNPEKTPSFEELLSESKKNLRNELLSAYICLSAFREQERSQDKVMAEEIIEFQTALAQCMSMREGPRPFHYPLQHGEKRHFEALFKKYQ